MKTNWIKYIIAGLCMSVLLVACNESDFLDLKNPNNQTEKDFWVNKKNAESALAAAYSPIRFQMYGAYGAFDGWLNIQSRGDETFTILNEEATMWNIATFSNSALTGGTGFSELYTGIQRANNVLHYIDLVPSDALNDKDRQMIKGEAYFLRGFQYFLLVQNFGEVPLRVIPSQLDDMTKPAAEKSVLWKQIEDDFQAAIDSDLPVKRSAGELGRVEKGAAVAMLAKTLITQGTQEKYQKAKKLLEELMTAPYQYALMDDYADNFRTHNPQGEYVEYNKESLFELSYSEIGEYTWWNESEDRMGSSIPQFIGPVAAGGWAKLMPSAFVVDEYLKEKRPASANTLFDKRMYASLFFNAKDYGDKIENEKWYGNHHDMDDLWAGNAGKMSPGAPEYSSVNGKEGRFLLKKYTAYYINDDAADLMSNKLGKANNVRLLRFAEVLLLHAEASYKLGDEAGANASLELIRDRAGLAKKTFSGQELMDEIEHQSLLEFYGEGHRFDDLRRWYTTEEMKQIFIKNKKQGAENFQAKHFYYPIPEGELNANAAISQNPLWK